MAQNQLIVGCAIIAKKRSAGDFWWLVIRQKEGGWEFPKVIARKGESSVRAVIRMAAEQGGMNAQVLNEAGHFISQTVLEGKSIQKRTLYYTMFQRAGGEMIGFDEAKWVNSQEIIKRLESKGEKEFFKIAKRTLKDFWGRNKKKQPGGVA